MKTITFDKTTKEYLSIESITSEVMATNRICKEIDETTLEHECKRYDFSLDENDNLVYTVNQESVSIELQIIKNSKLLEIQKYYDSDEFRGFVVNKDNKEITMLNNKEVRRWYFERYLIDRDSSFQWFLTDDDYITFNSDDVSSIGRQLAKEKDIMYKNLLTIKTEIENLTNYQDVLNYEYLDKLNIGLEKFINL